MDPVSLEREGESEICLLKCRSHGLLGNRPNQGEVMVFVETSGFWFHCKMANCKSLDKHFFFLSTQSTDNFDICSAVSSIYKIVVALQVLLYFLYPEGLVGNLLSCWTSIHTVFLSLTLIPLFGNQHRDIHCSCNLHVRKDNSKLNVRPCVLLIYLCFTSFPSSSILILILILLPLAFRGKCVCWFMLS